MNIFEKYLIKIKSLIIKNNKELGLINFNDFKGVVVENPPVEFNHDLSCNVALILGKLKFQNPFNLVQYML